MTDEDLVTVPEANTIIAELKHLAERGENLPPIMPKLIDQEAAAAMLGIGLSNFKKLERENAFSFKRKMVGTSVRYLNINVLKYIIENDVQ